MKDAKIVIIGAGSGFGGRLSMDIFSSPVLSASHIALCDIDENKLKNTVNYLQRFIDHHELPGKISASPDFRELLEGADFVISSVSVGGPAYWGEPFCSEIQIPRQYGIDQRWGDTLGPGGVFRFLRTAPVQLNFCTEMEKHCPEAILINYTNPMAMLTWLHSVGSSIQNTGLCHSVQGTTKKLARVADVPYEEVSFQVAGINHLAWVLSIKHENEDLYPKIREAADTHEEFANDRVRVELMKEFGCFPTESSEHNSEYLPYFRQTPENMGTYNLKKRQLETDEYEPPREWLKDSGIDDEEEYDIPPLRQSHEYVASMVEAYQTHSPFVFSGNVMNNGAIPNLPDNCCVEVPCVIDREGIHPCQVGKIPSQCAALDRSNINVQELAVEAVLTKNKEAAFHAIALDPLTSSKLTLPRIREMFNKLWDAEKGLLEYFEE